MIIVKLINQRLAQVAFVGTGAPGFGADGQRQLLSAVLAGRRRHPRHQQQLVRWLVQSTHKNQMVTNANQQQLIPIARNISFRQCPHNQHPTASKQAADKTASGLAKASFSMQASVGGAQSPFGASTAEFVAAQTQDFHVVVDESPLEALIKARKSLSGSKNKSKYYGQSFNESSIATTKDAQPKLVVLMSWLEAKEKHIEKYRQFYLERGFDVLNVKTSPWDLLLPNVGAKKISQDFVRFLVEKQYSDVVLHGFSVGGYMFGQVLLDIDRQEEQTRHQLLNSIKGLVFDSLVPFEGTCVGVANSITSNKLGAKIIENLIRLYLFLGHNIATKYYLEASDKVWGGPLKCPSLFLMSKDDKISDHRIIERLMGVWGSKGIETQSVLFDSSPHVQIFTKHHEVYVDRVEKFLKHVNMK